MFRPSTYAFAATITGLVAGLAIGSAFGSVLTGRVRRPELPLALALLAAAVAAGWASAFAAAEPLAIAKRFALSPEAHGPQLYTTSVLAAALVTPIAIALGIAFPLALELAGAHTGPAGTGDGRTVAERLGLVLSLIHI